MLTQNSAWWGESFVNELRRISETSDRKVQYVSRPVTGADASEKKAEPAPIGSPLANKESIPTKDTEADPTAVVKAKQDAADSLDTIQPPKKSATQ
jgi:trehalose 6-phosphate synthase